MRTTATSGFAFNMGSYRIRCHAGYQAAEVAAETIDFDAQQFRECD